MLPSNDDITRKLASHAGLLPGEIERLKAELAVMQWTGRAVVFMGIPVSFIVAHRLGMDGTLPNGAPFLAVGGAIAAYLLGTFAAYGLRLARVARLERRINERQQHAADGVSASGSAFAVPSLNAVGGAQPQPVSQDEDEGEGEVVNGVDVRAVKPHVVGALLCAVAAFASACDSGLCAELDALPREPRVLAIGDSILAWNNDRCHAIPERAGLVAGVHVTNKAVSGTVMQEIVAQYDAASSDDAAPWDVVIVDGGGNDVNSLCDCGACDAVLADVDERTNTLLDTIRDDGARVVLIDYFGIDDRSWYGFDRCEQALADLQLLHEEIDAQRDDVTLVDLGDLVVSPETHPEAYTFDWVHPSDEGSRILGELVAESLR